MNGFHVHAIGWVLMANAFTLLPAEAHELSDLWTDLVRRRAADLRQAPLLLHALFPRSLPLSPVTRAALAALVARMARSTPSGLARRRSGSAGIIGRARRRGASC